MKNLKIVLLPLLLCCCAFAKTNNDTEPLQQKVADVINDLDKATFKTVRTDWNHDYGLLPDTGMLNTYEYLHSLVSFEHLQTSLSVKIYTQGPHSVKNLDLTNNHQFGHYNPEFVLRFHAAIKSVLKDESFIKSTKAAMTTYGLISKLEKLQRIYYYIDENTSEFEGYVDDYKMKLEQKTWPSYGYRNSMPDKLDSDLFWNWSETVYHFWIRREIDGTKELWIEVVNDILRAYDMNE